MRPLVALVLAVLGMGLFAFAAIVLTGLSSTQHVGDQSLIVGNAVRSFDLAQVGTISGELSIDREGFWSLTIEHSQFVISAPAGSVLTTQQQLVVGAQEFIPGERVELQGGYSSTDVIFFWKIDPRDELAG